MEYAPIPRDRHGRRRGEPRPVRPGAGEHDRLYTPRLASLRSPTDGAVSQVHFGAESRSEEQREAVCAACVKNACACLAADDPLPLEFAGAYRRYHSCLMRPLCIGSVPPRQHDMRHACHDALFASMEALKPGRPIGEVFDAHAQVLDGAGPRAHRQSACG